MLRHSLGAKRAEAAINGLLDRLHLATLCLRELEAPIISGVHGVAAGAGLSLDLMAGIVVAANAETACPDAAPQGSARSEDMLLPEQFVERFWTDRGSGGLGRCSCAFEKRSASIADHRRFEG